MSQVLGLCLLICLCLFFDGHLSCTLATTLVCYKRPRPDANYGSSTGFDSRVSPKQLPDFCATNRFFKRTLHRMQWVSESRSGNNVCAGAPSHSAGAFYSAFRTAPSTSSSWVPPLVAPSRTNSVTEPSGYRFASRAPVVRRSPPASGKASARIKRSRSGTAHRQQSSHPSANRTPSASSSRRLSTGTVPEQAEPFIMRHDTGHQYDEFLASFQRRIDGMTGQSGGWGF